MRRFVTQRVIIFALFVHIRNGSAKGGVGGRPPANAFLATERRRERRDSHTRAYRTRNAHTHSREYVCRDAIHRRPSRDAEPHGTLTRTETARMAETLSDVANDDVPMVAHRPTRDARETRKGWKPGRGLTNEILRLGLRDAQTAKPRSATTVRAQAVRVLRARMMTLCVFTGWMVTTRCDARCARENARWEGWKGFFRASGRSRCASRNGPMDWEGG